MSVSHRMNFVKRRGSSAAKVTVENFAKLNEQFLLHVRAVVDSTGIIKLL